MSQQVDRDLMLRALELAARGHTHPNPRVGAVVAMNGNTVAEGFHEGPGTDHAEVVALKAAGDSSRGAELYVSLEPCSHHGLTPPCVEAIVGAGVARVIIGIEDPDRRVSGSGISFLRDAGIEVVLFDSPARAEDVDPAYFHHRRTGLPRVTAKYAMTLDGSVAAADGTSKWISSPQARADAHRLRGEVDAVVIGAGTLRSDDPRLDVRVEGYEGRQPRPVVIAGTTPLPADARIWERNPVVVVTDGEPPPGGEVVKVAGQGIPDPESAVSALADLGYIDLLLEGGPTLLAAWWSAGVVTRGYVYIGARMGGGAGIPPIAGSFGNIEDARTVEVFDVQSVGPDVRIGFQ